MEGNIRRRRITVPPAQLPDELIVEMLKYMTIHPLLDMRLVSIPWNNLIMSNDFGRLHRQQMIADNHWVYFFIGEVQYRPLRYDGCYIYYRSDRLNGGQPNQIDILCTCSGLVVGMPAGDELYIWNLMTNGRTTIQSQQIVCPPYVYTGCVSFSLGYNNATDDFMLVRIILFTGQRGGNEVMLYSRNRRTWTRGPTFPFETPILRSGIPFNGHLHWLVQIGNETTSIAAMSMSTFNYTLFQVASKGLGNIAYIELSMIGIDTLCLHSTLTPRGGTYHICMLLDYTNQNSWTRIDVELIDTICQFEYYVNLQPLHFINNDQTLILFRVNPVGSFGLLDTENGMFHDLTGFDIDIPGHLGVVRVLQTLERPSRPFT